MIAEVQTADGIFDVDVDAEEVGDLRSGARVATRPAPQVDLPLVLAAAASGSTVVAVVARRPPLVVSHDAGTTWHEAGGGLPQGRAVAVASDDPDVVVYAARNRLYVSRDGGRFWRVLAPELPEIEALVLREA